MRLDDDFEESYDEEELYEQKRANSQIRSAVAVIFFFVVVTLVVVLVASKGMQPRNTPPVENAYARQQEVKEGADAVISGSTLTAQDLDFWDDYKDGSHPAIVPAEPEPSAPTEPEEGATVTISAVSDNSSDSVSENETANDPSTDGKHTLITHADGTTEWADINPYLAGHGYDLSGLVYQKPFMQYYENNTKHSFVGVDISKDEDYVDFNRLKNAGVDFVMLRLGQRGYSTGELSLDENFLDNYERAREADLDIGVYFVTAAISLEEAKEEADFCLSTVSENGIRLEYPLALSTQKLGSGKSRTDGLEKMPRTNMALTFMDAVAQEGFFPLLYGNKETLIRKYSLGSMIGYEIWYSEAADLPDYPYQFVMWQYDLGGEIDGIAGGAHMNICFTDYSLR